jgi:hypothetical protein
MVTTLTSTTPPDGIENVVLPALPLDHPESLEKNRAVLSVFDVQG